MADKHSTYRAKLRAQGLCVRCGEPAAPFYYCNTHRAYKSTNFKKQYTTKRKRPRYLGSRYSPERTDYWLLRVRKNNPMLAQHWKDVKEFVRAHIEEFIEPSDSVLAFAISMNDMPNDWWSWKIKGHSQSPLMHIDFTDKKIRHKHST